VNQTLTPSRRIRSAQKAPCRLCRVVRWVSAALLLVVTALVIGLNEMGQLSGGDNHPNAVQADISPLDGSQQ
jgi:hypothetical protein